MRKEIAIFCIIFSLTQAFAMTSHLRINGQTTLQDYDNNKLVKDVDKDLLKTWDVNCWLAVNDSRYGTPIKQLSDALIKYDTYYCVANTTFSLDKDNITIFSIDPRIFLTYISKSMNTNFISIYDITLKDSKTVMKTKNVLYGNKKIKQNWLSAYIEYSHPNNRLVETNNLEPVNQFNEPKTITTDSISTTNPRMNVATQKELIFSLENKEKIGRISINTIQFNDYRRLIEDSGLDNTNLGFKFQLDKSLKLYPLIATTERVSNAFFTTEKSIGTFTGITGAVTYRIRTSFILRQN